MIRPPQCVLYWVLLTCLVAGVRAAADAQEKNTKVTMHSEVRMRRVPVPEIPEGASPFDLSAIVNDEGEGHGTLTLDPNPYAIDEFGATQEVTGNLAISIRAGDALTIVPWDGTTEPGKVDSTLRRHGRILGGWKDQYAGDLLTEIWPEVFPVAGQQMGRSTSDRRQ
jgi:hypothetical protein